MKKILLISITLSLVFIFFCSWYVINEDLVFHTDIARDFLLLNEITHKNIQLIGPRADWKGLFHGPLWLYFNLPAYLVGHGNPIIVGWFWILATIIFTFIYYFLLKKLFDKKTALLFIPLFLASITHFTSNFYNPIGALFLMPLFYYSIVQYSKTNKIFFLMLSMFLAGLIFQFQIAVGGPIIILSTLLFIYKIIKNKKYSHLLGLFIVLIPLSTFIVFDLRHNFMQTSAILNHFNGTEKYYSMSFMDKLFNRLTTMVNSGIGLTRNEFSFLNIIASYLLTVMIYYSLSKKKLIEEYLLFIYIYVGFYVLSLLHQSTILVHYFLPLIPLPIIIFSTLNKYLGKKIFYSFYVLIVVLNLIIGLKSIKDSKTFFNINKTSWKGILKVAETTFKNSDSNQEFGLYLFAPDMYGYSQKYAFTYGQTLYPNKKMIFSQKRKVTFLVYEPPPQDKPWIDGTYWKTDLVKINKQPTQTINLSNGFRMEKYILNDEELNIQSDSILIDWVSQR